MHGATIKKEKTICLFIYLTRYEDRRLYRIE